MKNLLFLAAVAAFLSLFIYSVYNIPVLYNAIIGPTNQVAQNCIDLGGKRVQEKDRAGNVYAFCRFPDGTVCEEWALYRGECRSSFTH